MIAIIIVIIMIVYLFYKKKSEQVNKQTSDMDLNNDRIENYSNSKKRHRKKSHIKKMQSLSYNDNVLPQSFIEAQWHTDYRDTLTAFGNIATSQRQTYNLANLPSTMTNIKPNNSETKYIIKDFIDELNNNVLNVVPEYRQINSGWDEQMPDPDKEYESGWDKHMKKLGLPKSLYPDPAKKAPVKLVRVDHIEKYETEDETKYACYLMLKKQNTEDVIVVRISFIIDKNTYVNKDRTMFMDNHSSHSSSNENTIIIEEIVMIGYLSNIDSGMENDFRTNFYKFSNIENGGITSDAEILHQLNMKQKERMYETQQFNSGLDFEQRHAKKDHKKLGEYISYKNTRTIFDDMMKPKKFN